MLVNRACSFLYRVCVYTVSQIKHYSSLTDQSFQEDKTNIPNEANQEKVLKVSIIGMPNAGKSTFINSLMDRKVCAVSSKVHTTRLRSRAIFTLDDTQVVFLDTPGLVNDREYKRFNLEGSFIRDPRKCSQEADIIGVVHDVSNKYTREVLDIKLINILEKHQNTPSFLVLNKIDMLKSKRKLLDITRLLTENHIDGKLTPGSKELHKNESVRGWKYFKDVFMVSSLVGNGLDDVKNYLASKAKPGKWLFPNHVWTDQPAETVILNTVKATLLDFLPQEIPYQLKPIIEYFDISEEGVISASVIVQCPNAKKAALVAGVSDGKLRQIIETVQKNLQDAFLQRVRLQIVLEVRK